MRIFITLAILLFTVLPVAAQDKSESVYDRVMRTGVIKCGYTPYSVGLMKDANTGGISGIYKDIIDAVGQTLNLSIQYVEEVGWGQQIEGLNAGRYDMICSPASVTGARSRSADYSRPLYYSPVYIWMRSDDTRFNEKAMKDFNDPSIKISTLDGEQTDAMAEFHFPKAEKVSLPQSSDFSALMMNVINGKADITFAEPLTVNDFMKTNPDTLKQVDGLEPLTLVPNIFLIKRDEYAFKAMIDNALMELFFNGRVDKAINKHESYPDSYIRVSNP